MNINFEDSVSFLEAFCSYPHQQGLTLSNQIIQQYSRTDSKIRDIWDSKINKPLDVKGLIIGIEEAIIKELEANSQHAIRRLRKIDDANNRQSGSLIKIFKRMAKVSGNFELTNRYSALPPPEVEPKIFNGREKGEDTTPSWNRDQLLHYQELRAIRIDNSFSKAFPDDYLKILSTMIENNPKLEEIALSEVDISSELLINWINQKSNALKCLKIRNLNLNEEDLEQLLQALTRNGNRLEELKISDLQNGHLKHLRSLSNLKKLSLEDCHDINEIGLFSLSTCERLEHLDLGYMPFSDQTMQRIAKNHANLKQLRVRGNITNEGLAALKNCSGLRDIRLTFTDEGITDWGLKEFASHHLELENISLTDAKLISDIGICFLSPCKKVKSVTIVHSNRITPNVIRQMSCNLPLIRKMRFINCKNIKKLDPIVMTLVMRNFDIEVI